LVRDPDAELFVGSIINRLKALEHDLCELEELISLAV